MTRKLTKTGIYWKLLVCLPSSEMLILSLSTKAISIILDNPAAIKVYPKVL